MSNESNSMVPEYPSVAEVLRRRQTEKLGTRVTADLYALVQAKQRRTGVSVSEMLRRAAQLWVDGRLDELLTQVYE